MYKSFLAYGEYTGMWLEIQMYFLCADKFIKINIHTNIFYIIQSWLYGFQKRIYVKPVEPVQRQIEFNNA